VDAKKATFAQYIDKQLENEFRNEELASLNKQDLNETLSKEKVSPLCSARFVSVHLCTSARRPLDRVLPFESGLTDHTICQTAAMSTNCLGMDREVLSDQGEHVARDSPCLSPMPPSNGRARGAALHNVAPAEQLAVSHTPGGASALKPDGCCKRSCKRGYQDGLTVLSTRSINVAAGWIRQL
jgi:hypothetical protein